MKKLIALVIILICCAGCGSRSSISIIELSADPGGLISMFGSTKAGGIIVRVDGDQELPPTLSISYGSGVNKVRLGQGSIVFSGSAADAYMSPYPGDPVLASDEPYMSPYMDDAVLTPDEVYMNDAVPGNVTE
jgi:hypothetical protein